MDDFAIYNGKNIDLREKMAQILNGMKDDEEFEGMVSMPRFSEPVDIKSVPRTQTLATFLNKASPKSPNFEQTAFSDPFFIAYSSGTTGIPKCIVHSVGGAVLSSAKEGKLHREMNADSVALQYTTTGWIMYFSSVMNLLGGSRVILYDGSPFQPDLKTFVRMIGEQKVTKLGTSPRWMHELHENGVLPKDVTDLSHLRMVTSTGMVLSDRLFEWFYDEGFPAHVHLANISGGTDLVCPHAQSRSQLTLNRPVASDKKILSRPFTWVEHKGLVWAHQLQFMTLSLKEEKEFQERKLSTACLANWLPLLHSPTCLSSSGTTAMDPAISTPISRNMTMSGPMAIL